MKYSLEGINGNAYCLMAYVVQAMESEQFPQKQIEEYLSAAKSRDYHYLCSVTWQQVEEVNDFVEFWNNFCVECGYITVSKKIAVEFFLNQGNDIDQFRDYVLANDLVEEVEL